MHDDSNYPELPDFLNRKKNPELNEERKPGWNLRRKPDAIIWPSKAINKALRAKASAAKAARKAKAKAKAEALKKWGG